MYRPGHITEPGQGWEHTCRPDNRCAACERWYDVAKATEARVVELETELAHGGLTTRVAILNERVARLEAALREIRDQWKFEDHGVWGR